MPRLAEEGGHTAPRPSFHRQVLVRLGKDIMGISEDAMLLVDYDYPGNVRELENIIERAALEAGIS